MRLEGKLEPIMVILVGLMVFYTLTLFLAEWKFQTDAVFFQATSNILSGIVGAFLARIKGPTEHSSGIEDPKSSLTVIKEESKDPPLAP